MRPDEDCELLVFTSSGKKFLNDQSPPHLRRSFCAHIFRPDATEASHKKVDRIGTVFTDLGEDLGVTTSEFQAEPGTSFFGPGQESALEGTFQPFASCLFSKSFLTGE